MANTFNAFGFKSFGRLDGGAPTMGQMKVQLLSSDSNTYYTGDVVQISTSGYLTFPASGSVTGSPIAGIFNGCEYYSPTVGRVIWSAQSGGNVTSSAPGLAYVITDPQHLFIAQGSTNAVLGTSVIGWNIGFVSSGQGNGNTTTGMSVVCLASSTPAATNTLPFRVIDTYTNFAPPGTNGTSTGAEAAQIMVVQMNNQWLRSLTGVST